MLCTRQVLPMPASPSMPSADARPPLSWRTAAAATASSASRPTSPPTEDTLKASPTPKASPSASATVQPKAAYLSLYLIHRRPPPFTGGHADRVCAVCGRWRTLVNAGQHCWKACWGQPLRSSNLLSSATSDQPIHQGGHGPVRLRSLICSPIHSTHIGIKHPKRAGRTLLVAAH